MGRRPDPAKKERLVAATLKLVRTKGYANTSVEDICAEADVTRGSFFFYAKTKEEMVLAALDLYAAEFRAHYVGAGVFDEPDPIKRVHKYLDACVSFAHAPLAREGCFLGVLSQEISLTHARVRVRCQAIFDTWSGGIEAILVDAFRAAHKDPTPARTLAPFIVGVVEGSLLYARVHRDRAEVDRAMAHVREHVAALLR